MFNKATSIRNKTGGTSNQCRKIKAFIIFSSVFQWQNQVSPKMLKIDFWQKRKLLLLCNDTYLFF